MLYSPVPMHIPDGFLSVLVSVLCWAIAIPAVGYALKRVEKDLDGQRLPLMGVLAACIFAGQMLNFSVTWGTSGHLLGAALATILLGPWAALVVITCVVGVQALVFQDGGLLALGANIVNMGVVGVAVSYFTYRTVQGLAKGRSWGPFAGAAASGWLSIVIASLACALQLALSRPSIAGLTIPAMAGIHMLIGIGEAAITVGAVAFLYATRRDLVQSTGVQTGMGKAVWVAGLSIAVLLAIVSPLASAHPDGLEWVAEQIGFLDAAQEPFYTLIPDYVFPGISNEALATILAGIVGALIVLGAALAVGYTRRKAQSAALNS